MMEINPAKVWQDRLASALGLDQYQVIMSKAQQVDVSADAAFQQSFNGYYRIRRNAPWRESYYRLFEHLKHAEQVTFDGILDALYAQTGNVEASFSSKMLATLRPEMPIWDQYVVRNLGLKVPSATDPQRLDQVKALYASLVRWYEEFLTTDNAKVCLNKFDEMLPDYTWVSDVKKIDSYLWSIR